MKLILACLLLLSSALFAADAGGKWKANFESPNGSMQLTFDFKVDGAKLTGTVSSDMGEMQISEGKVDGDKIEFTVATDQFSVKHKGTIAGDEMKLKVEIGDNAFDMTAKRAK